MMILRTALTVVFALGLLAAPLAAEAQAGKVYRLGYLFEGAPIVPEPPQSKALEERLRELGYVEGRNLVIERRYAAFKYDRLPELAADLVRFKPDVILAGGNPSIAALKHATTTVPVVMTWSIDPVGAGLITSLARPGGNITGASLTTGAEFRDGGDRVGGAEARHHGRVRGRTYPHRHADPIYFRASAAKRHGILTLPARAIHIELPRAVRMEGDGYARVLAEFLTRAAPLLLQP